MAFIAEDHGEGAMHLGVLLGAITIVGLIGNQIYRRLPGTPQTRSKSLAWGVALAALITLLLGLSHNLVSDLVLLVVMGVAWELIEVGGISALQIDLPQEIRGRTIGMFYV
jgi:MFS family permease